MIVTSWKLLLSVSVTRKYDNITILILEHWVLYYMLANRTPIKKNIQEIIIKTLIVRKFLKKYTSLNK